MTMFKNTAWLKMTKTSIHELFFIKIQRLLILFLNYYVSVIGIFGDKSVVYFISIDVPWPLRTQKGWYSPRFHLYTVHCLLIESDAVELDLAPAEGTP